MTDCCLQYFTLESYNIDLIKEPKKYDENYLLPLRNFILEASIRQARLESLDDVYFLLTASIFQCHITSRYIITTQIKHINLHECMHQKAKLANRKLGLNFVLTFKPNWFFVAFYTHNKMLKTNISMSR